MNPGVYSLGISEEPPRYLSSKFDASVRSDCWDISIWKTLTQCDGNGNANANANANANVDDRGDYNSSPCTSYRRAKNWSVCVPENQILAEAIKFSLRKHVLWLNMIILFIRTYKSQQSKQGETGQSAQWGTYTPDQRYRHFLKSTKYVALTLEMAVVCYML